MKLRNGGAENIWNGQRALFPSRNETQLAYSCATFFTAHGVKSQNRTKFSVIASVKLGILSLLDRPPATSFLYSLLTPTRCRYWGPAHQRGVLLQVYMIHLSALLFSLCVCGSGQRTSGVGCHFPHWHGVSCSPLCMPGSLAHDSSVPSFTSPQEHVSDRHLLLCLLSHGFRASRLLW